MCLAPCVQVKYVLICITPQYCQEVWNTATSANLAPASSPCHLIYRLMLQEYQKCQGINRRFVPLLCSGATFDHVPPFLRNANPSGYPQIRTYIYPQDHENLFYFLADPEEVVNNFIRRQTEKEKKALQKEEDATYTQTVAERSRLDAVVKESSRLDAVVKESSRLDAVVKERSKLGAVVKETSKLCTAVSKESI